MSAAPPMEELDALLRLLDDETPEVRTRVAERMARYGGDLSEWLSSEGRELNDHELHLLGEMLRPGRRENLEKEWIVPTGGAAALREDWDRLESLLRILSDFLHDGVTLRQPLSDALDLLAEEAEEAGVRTERELAVFLFGNGRLEANQSGYYDPRNSDLAWSIAEGKSNPLGLCLIYLLVARRLDMEVEGVSFPGHFLCRIHEEGLPWIVDCFDKGRCYEQDELIRESEHLTRPQREILKETADPGTILKRLTSNLIQALRQSGQTEDARLISRLRSLLG